MNIDININIIEILIFVIITFIIERITIKWEIKYNKNLFYALYREDVIKILKKEGLIDKQ